MSQVHIVVGGQFGSEGKGHFVAELAKDLSGYGTLPMTIRTGGPNAGHTVVDDAGRVWKLRQIPATAVVLPDAPVALSAGCEIDTEVLNQEIYLMEEAGIPVLERLLVDKQATLLESFHMKREQTDRYTASSEESSHTQNLVDRIGSTGKGVGAARADRIMREAGLYGGSHDVAEYAARWLADAGEPVIIEATQGYGLGLHAGYYPKCTSRDVRAIDVMAEAGISPWQEGVDHVIIWVVFRPFPIRVAGDSGPLYKETTWEKLELEPEYTTVTQKMRRVGHWDPILAHKALLANGHPGGDVRPVLMFADQVDYELESVEKVSEFKKENWDFIGEFERTIDSTFWGFGTGPATFAWRYGASEAL